tara:strand:- start:828 stop:1388 length:561 start_codon:yes stop_codon:yes gene_type:complete
MNAEFEVVSRPDLPQEVVVQFTIIPGGLYGIPLTDSQYLDVIQIGSSINADFRDLERRIASFATPMLNTEANMGLSISPKETRLARFGTFTYDLNTREGLGTTGFGSPDPEIFALVLTYFDRAAEIRGIQNIEGEIADFNINVERAGLVWLKVKKKSKDHFSYSVLETPSGAFLLIQPQEPGYTEI